jgi:hypothetical protein
LLTDALFAGAIPVCFLTSSFICSHEEGRLVAHG